MLTWQEERKKEAREKNCVHTLLGRARQFPSVANATNSQKGHIERAAINTPVQVCPFFHFHAPYLSWFNKLPCPFSYISYVPNCVDLLGECVVRACGESRMGVI